MLTKIKWLLAALVAGAALLFRGNAAKAEAAKAKQERDIAQGVNEIRTDIDSAVRKVGKTHRQEKIDVEESLAEGRTDQLDNDWKR